MALLKLPYVQEWVRNGRQHLYYRRGGYRVPLPSPVGSEDFLRAYAAAQAADPQAAIKAASEAGRIPPRSIDALIIEFYRSGDFVTLAPATKRTYRGVFDRFRNRTNKAGVRIGSWSCVTLTTKHLEKIFLEMAETPEAVRNLRKRLIQLFGFAVRLGWRRDNPARETKAPRRRRDAGIKPWTENEIEKFRLGWAVGTRQRLALELLLHTGQRRSDIAKMTHRDIAGGRISVAQQKTTQRLKIKIHPTLAAELDLHSSDGPALVLTSYGDAYSVEGFGNWFREACAAAGVSGYSHHGLRKAQGRRLAEAGCSEKQIAAILGHESLNEVARYTRDANRVRLADDAMTMLESAGEPKARTA
ncbi:MAG: hypothetical protein EON58_02385 [Alphaproteobacteria bacterium]|nr:MAG: hypothetical protein EON58_02385 [Alphaproteobacteria bacterium]